ncbi:MAG: dihydrodipicolinate synthase family protein [bacterium]
MKDTGPVIPAMMTPFRKDGSINFDYIPKHLSFFRRAGIKGVLVSGTNGEFPSMTVAERKELIEFVVKSSEGMFVLAGVGCCDLESTLLLAHHAQNVGADGIMVVPPFYFTGITVDGLYLYYRSILDATDIDLYLYHIPKFTGVPISLELVERLADHPRLRGIKDTGGDMSYARALVERFPHLQVFVGNDHKAFEAAGMGSAGNISAIANCFPELILSVRRNADGRGAETQGHLSQLKNTVEKYPLIAGMKFVLQLKGFEESYVRPPLIDLNDRERESLRRDLEEEI